MTAIVMPRRGTARQALKFLRIAAQRRRRMDWAAGLQMLALLIVAFLVGVMLIMALR
jgi:hypothetical protein